MTRRLVQVCNTVMEVSWLLALVSIPIFFNIYTSRVFEPDKITLFRTLALVMAAAWLMKELALKAADQSQVPAPRPGTRRTTRPLREDFLPDGEVIGPDNRPFTRKIIARPLMIPAYILSFAYIAATLISIVPGVSWWGSYDRLQGTYTFFSYVVFFLVIAFNMRERRQVERAITFILLTNLPVTLYGIMQHNKADPLPWQGDTTFRVTSTMGNAIFIAAYLIMVATLVMYRLLTTGKWLIEHRTEFSRNSSGRARNTALSWFALYGFFFLFMLGLFMVVLNMNANYRPETTGVARASGSIESAGTAAGTANQLVGGTTIGPFWSLPLAVLISFGIFFLFTVKRKDTDNNYLFRMVEFGCYLLLIGLALVVIIYSKSRGPLAGLLVGLFLLPPILFAVYKKWRLLAGWLGVGLLGGLLLLLFNLPAGSTPFEPVFKELRKNPEIARFGEFLQTEDGTGKVRRLIWETDFEILGNAASKDPLRLILGHGPESMYYITPRFYQPELGWYEARNAIPDRSHNAYLDSLVTTGIFGLIAYMAFLGLYFYYCVYFLRRTRRFEYRVLLACLMSGMVGHLVEIITGIQIVSSWMMFWFFGGLVVVIGGLVKGSHDPQEVTQVQEQKKPDKEPVAVEAGVPREKKARTPERSTRSGAKVTTIRSNSPAFTSGFFDASLYNVPDAPVKGWYWAVLVAVVVFSLYFAIVANFMPIAADTAFKQGQNLASSQRPDEAIIYYRQAATTAVQEDRYALYLGQGYLDLADKARTSEQQKTSQNQQPAASILNLAINYLKLSEAELKRANEIAPLNPDHYSNLARLYGQWLNYEPARRKELLNKQIEWYEKTLEYAPRNARIRGEYAATLVNASRNNDGTVDQKLQERAIAAGEEAVRVDPCFEFPRWVLGDIYLGAGKADEAASQHARVAELAPKEMGNNNSRYLQRLQIMAASPQVNPALFIPNLQSFVARKDVKQEPVAGLSDDPCAEVRRAALSRELTDTDKAFIYQTMGIYLYHQNRQAEAESRLVEANRLSPSSAFTHAYLAAIYKRSNREQQAAQESQKALELAGQNTELRPVIEGFLASNAQ
jgi:tetratricopeptide (TPR) repeat protein/O-antigen ligase